MNLEILWPASENVVNYDITELMFHGALEYDDAGRVIAVRAWVTQRSHE